MRGRCWEAEASPEALPAGDDKNRGCRQFPNISQGLAQPGLVRKELTQLWSLPSVGSPSDEGSGCRH